MDTAETGFNDKQGKPIRIGDILQHRLDANGRAHGGPTVHRVVRFGKHINLVSASQPDDARYGGHHLTEQFAKSAVIIDRAH